MALQVGVSTVRLLFLLGAGVTGSVIVTNGRITDFVSDITSVVSKHLDPAMLADKVADTTSDLSKQVMRMTKELQALSEARGVTVVNAAPSSSGSVGSIAMPVVVVGAAGYGYFRFRGWTVGDFMYVTKKHMANAITEVSKQFEQVSTNLKAARMALSSRIDGVSKTLKDSGDVQDEIKDKVLDIRSDMEQCGGKVLAVQQVVVGLEGKLYDVQTKQAIAQRGIYYLYHCLDGLSNGKEKLELPQGLKPQLLENGDMKQSGAGLKELEQLIQKLENDTDSSSSSSISSSSSSKTESSQMDKWTIWPSRSIRFFAT